LIRSEAVRKEVEEKQRPPRIALFGEFLLCRAERRLEAGGEALAIGSRALDILIILVERSGEVVTRRELLDTVWPDLVVEESNLRVHVANLRKVLGDADPSRFIANIPGRGYSFIAPVAWVDNRDDASNVQVLPPAPMLQNGVAEDVDALVETKGFGVLPKSLTRIVGRAEMIDELMEQLRNRRLISITGPGGIGKTTVALAVAARMSPEFADGVIFVDLGPVKQDAFLPKALAAALGVAIEPQNALSQLVEAIGAKHLLIVLDCCEHVIEAAAEYAAGLLHFTENLTILATSREALRAEGEWVHRVSPLDLPEEWSGIRALEALAYPAVQLFCDRADESLGGFELADSDAPVVAEICSKLDGVALAIELAAGRMNSMSLSELKSQIEDRLKLLRYGRRTALPRHQTLSAALDWSYDLLSSREQKVLNRLSVLNGTFSLREAIAICRCEVISAEEVEDILIELSAKSLVATKAGSDGTGYRLLDTTRSYTRRKLEDSGENEVFFSRHARHFCETFQCAAEVWESTPTATWIDRYVPKIEDLRGALNWAFSKRGDVTIGVALVLAAVPLWSQLSLVDEFLFWIGHALERAELIGDRSKAMYMQLHAALGGLQMYALSTAGEARTSLEKALHAATEIDDRDYTLRLLRALWAEAVNSGDLRRSMTFAKRFKEFAVGIEDKHAEIVADRLIGTSFHYLGDQTKAACALQSMITAYGDRGSHTDLVRYQFDQRLTARMIFARVLWLKGQTQQARTEVEAVVDASLELAHTMSLCNVLSQCACPIALFERDEEAARNYLSLLKKWTRPRALDVWQIFADCYEAEIDIEFGNVDRGLEKLGHCRDRLERSFKSHRLSFLVASAKGLFAQGRLVDSKANIIEALEITQVSGEGWRLPELYRWLGEIEASLGGHPDVVHRAYNMAITTSAEQGSVALELRAMTSLARWKLSTGECEAELERLAVLCARFRGEDCTVDHRDALALLDGSEGGKMLRVV